MFNCGPSHLKPWAVICRRLAAEVSVQDGQVGHATDTRKRMGHRRLHRAPDPITIIMIVATFRTLRRT